MDTVTRPLVIQEERIETFYRDALPLFQEHYAEMAPHKDIALDINIEAYQRAQQFGGLRIFSARNAGKLVGYAIFIVAPNSHYKTSQQAKQDILYVEKSMRGSWIGMQIVNYADRALAAAGVQVCYYDQKVAHPALGAILRRAGYDHIENVWGKRLDLNTENSQED